MNSLTISTNTRSKKVGDLEVVHSCWSVVLKTTPLWLSTHAGWWQVRTDWRPQFLSTISTSCRGVVNICASDKILGWIRCNSHTLCFKFSIRVDRQDLSDSPSQQVELCGLFRAAVMAAWRNQSKMHLMRALIEWSFCLMMIAPSILQ